MTSTDSHAVMYAEHNKKRAYYAMCKAVILLCVFTALTYACNYLFNLIFYTNSSLTEECFVKVLVLFGVPRLSAIMTAKNLMMSYSVLEIVRMIIVGISVLVPATVFAKRAGLSGDECFSVRGKFIKGLYPMMGLCQMTIMFVLFAANSFGAGFVEPVFGPLSEISLFGGGTYGDESVIDYAIAFIGTCVFVPLAEEYTFRGVIFSYLRKYGTAFSMVASSLIFGVAHSDPAQAVFAFGFGLMASFLVVVTGNMKTAILCHSLNNFLYMIENYTYGTSFGIVVLLFRMSLYAFGFLGVYHLMKKGGHMDTFSEKVCEKDCHLESKPGLKQVFCPPMIVFIILNVAVYIGEVVK